MSTSEHIQRIKIDPDGLDFETLRQEAISKIQGLCGDVWTDYNLHDPGVTILDQLCYGLTDLSHRSEFEVPDYLTNEKGSIDYQRHALFSPEEVFPSSAVTEIDYQKILYDEIPEIDYVWLESCSAEENTAINCLYTVFVKIDDELNQNHSNNSKRHGSLDRLFSRLKQISRASDQVRGLFDQLGDRLNIWHENLEKECEIVENDSLPRSEPEVLIDQVKRTLRLLVTNLSYVDSVWSQINAIWSIIHDSSPNAELSSRLSEILFKLEAVFSNANLKSSVTYILTAIGSDPADKVSIETDCLTRLITSMTGFEHALQKLNYVMLEMGNGLFSPIVTTDQSTEKLNDTAIKQKILSVFLKHRNLCEDIHRIEIIQTIPYFLGGEVEIQPSYKKAKIYAEIFLKCAHYISSGIQIDRYESVFNQTGNYEQIFSGPLTRHGYISDQWFESAQEVVLSVVDLITLVNQIEGVIQVRDLYLIDQYNKKSTAIEYNSLKYIFPDLCFPRPGKPQQILQLVLSQNASRKDSDRHATSFVPPKYPQDEALLKETYLELKKLIFEYRAFRNNDQSFSQFIRLPKGRQRALADYFSIQNHFPDVYGINRYGISHSESADVKARAKQLKAYLFPFEQLMADYLQNLQEIPRLFSLDSELKQSYFAQFLSDQNIPGIESLYVIGKEHCKSLLIEIQAHYDHFAERRNRILDTLLALYGEEYPQDLLLQFDCYRRSDFDHWIIENKINFLKCIREITRDRAAGFNYLQPAMSGHHEVKAGNIAGAHKRISILLGCSQFHSIPSITDILIKRNSRLIPDQTLIQEDLTEEMQHAAISVIFEKNKFESITIPLELPPFGYSLFKKGTDLKNYRLITSGDKTVVYIKTEQDKIFWPLGSKQSVNEAIRYAHDYCSVITQLNMACENFHMIEHVLLRPRGQGSFDNIPESKFSFDFRISVIFPSWTARFSSAAFRKFAQETVLKNLPAHVFAEFYWLDFGYMRDFEQCYKIWLFRMRHASQNPDHNDFEKLNRASERVISCLLKNRREAVNEHWI
ncbi:hypothetical protein [Nitrosomonas supralitoralis]|uniref:Uncharacterized protein n=1 Tax=Nitrosomonas supralitoralis TaxID=2116706 RepID=A0A2P7NZR1_9PROT|nr:hypothetical protein [Nitrosomonas supralitoralis]PSJ18960.1 hypothetical protein C7H79_00570 [Nitrosomonas supralitoralis]